MVKLKKLIPIVLLLLLLSLSFCYKSLFYKKEIQKNINLLKTTDTSRHNKAVENLVKIGSPAVEPLIHSLKYDTGKARSVVLYSASTFIKHKYIVKASNQSYLENYYLKLNAIRALGRIGDRKAVKPLINCIKDEDYNIRNEALKSLMKMGTPPVEPITEAISVHNENTRYEIASFLGKIDDPDTINILLEMLRKESRYVQKSVAHSIEEKDLKTLHKLTKHENFQVRFIAWKGLLRSINLSENEELTKKLLSDKDYEIRLITVQRLAEIGDNKSIDTLLTTLRDKETREVSLKKLLDLYNPYTEKKLIPMLKDKNPRVRSDAAYLLCHSAESHKLPELISPLLKNDSKQVKIQIINGLEQNTGKEVDRLLISALNDKTHDISLRAIKALQGRELGNIKDISPFILALARKFHHDFK